METLTLVDLELDTLPLIDAKPVNDHHFELLKLGDGDKPDQEGKALRLGDLLLLGDLLVIGLALNEMLFKPDAVFRKLSLIVPLNALVREIIGLALEFTVLDNGTSCKTTVITIPVFTTDPSVVKPTLIKGVFLTV